MEEVKSFHVMLLSDDESSLADFPRNSSCSFSNLLWKPLKLHDGLFEVGLSQIYFEVPPSVDSASTLVRAATGGEQDDEPYMHDQSGDSDKSFFRPNTDDNKVTVWILERKRYAFPKNGSSAALFKEHVNKFFSDRAIRIRMTEVHTTTELPKFRLYYTENTNFELQFSPLLQSILGFTQSGYLPGSYLAANPYNNTTYQNSDFQTNAYIDLIRWNPNYVRIPEPDVPDFETRLAFTAKTLRENGFEVVVHFNEETEFTLKLLKEEMRVQFSPMMNQYMELDNNFIFSQAETTVIIPEEHRILEEEEDLEETTPFPPDEADKSEPIIPIPPDQAVKPVLTGGPDERPPTPPDEAEKHVNSPTPDQIEKPEIVDPKRVIEPPVLTTSSDVSKEEESSQTNLTSGNETPVETPAAIDITTVVNREDSSVTVLLPEDPVPTHTVKPPEVISETTPDLIDKVPCRSRITAPPITSNDDNDESVIEFPVVPRKRRKKDSGLHSIYVCCNLIDPQCFGGQALPCLRTVNRLRNEHSMSIEFNPILYLPVVKSDIRSISISLVDAVGECIPTLPELVTRAELVFRHTLF